MATPTRARCARSWNTFHVAPESFPFDPEAALARYASRSRDSRGRLHGEPPPAYRTEFQRDRDRIVHCGAFRRLEYKTQVFVNHVGDMYRTRLTHTIEVAQIARSIARALRLNEDLAEAIALAHDLGHTPFGHAGQEALNDCMRPYGGFEHNRQSLRVVDLLETRYADFDGLNLCFETREGILKHCARKNAAELGAVAARFLQGGQPSLEAQLTNLADEIAYNNHDVDDGLRSGLICIDQLRQIDLFAAPYEAVARRYGSLPPRRHIAETVRRMINSEVSDLIATSAERLAQAAPQDPEEVRIQPAPLIAYSEAMAAHQRQLKRFLYRALYRHPQVTAMNQDADALIRALFDHFMSHPDDLPADTALKAQNLLSTNGTAGQARTVADHIAGMTDRFALEQARRLGLAGGLNAAAPAEPSFPAH
ncbi:deoxyguanosinetriphosphate triphosphohydrolase [Candidatus Macondimonas diazotrophica]|uniref:Deoxyguanosinetriphosphate triphosphohydrolase-like protein n=1 Tax=Candidatus Macondimonas diazotrophica TaxID=2305248 RepID=A0A4Z0FA79_9GAMM|nr:deoxyguanosinetriphosphate triphosphohydrolase [Candidatus Macondimonas diazotrophica]TFZ83040.1 deoxyguanosinetriphosphate triphosphohydrolase [Candidatus Macondimonas diazotrophica]